MSQEFVVTARKWRPQQFKDVVGQEHITQTLQNSIRTGRVHHANLFCGPRGVGKTTTARIHARALNCLNPQNFEPCNECESCLAILSNTSMDVIEIDGASNNSVDDIRKLRENAKYPPSVGKYKMFIIDEVHMLSTSAFNALLKILEEPPKHLLFVFATTESHKVPATIISRCQRFDFRRMEIESIVNQLKYISSKEGITIDEASLVTIAKKGDGSMRDSQSIFDRAIAFCGKDVKFTELANSLHLIDEEFYFKIGKYIKDKSIGELFLSINEIMNKGYDLTECLRGLIEYYRNILTIKETNNPKLIDSTEDYVRRYKSEADEIPRGDILRYINYLIITEKEIKFAAQPRIKFELALVQLASMNSVLEIEVLINELKQLKQFIADGNLGQIELGTSDLTTSNNEVEKKNFELIDNNTESKAIESKVEDNTTNFINEEIVSHPIVIESITNQVLEPKVDYPNVNYPKAAEIITELNKTPIALTQSILNQKWNDLVINRVFTSANLSSLNDCRVLLVENLLGETEIKIITDSPFYMDVFKSKRTEINELIISHIAPNVSVSFECNEEAHTSLSNDFVTNNFRNNPVKESTKELTKEISIKENNLQNININNIEQKFSQNENYPQYDEYSIIVEKPFELMNNDSGHVNINQNSFNQNNSNQNSINSNNDEISNGISHPNILKSKEIDKSKLNFLEKFIVEKFNADMIIE
ncbi:MAG: DNA polymerase III subunit gamma/tau [Candidatus Kapaibacteriota bacterium]|jgi:DNA polymerase-3 subunit gamma/tau